MPLEMCPCSGARNFGKKLRGGDISASATAGAHGARRSAPTPWTTSGADPNSTLLERAVFHPARMPVRPGRIFGDAAQAAAELRQLFWPQVAVLLLASEQQRLDVAVDQVGAIVGAGIDGVENLRQVARNEGDEVVAHRRADVADAQALGVGAIRIREQIFQQRAPSPCPK